MLNIVLVNKKEHKVKFGVTQPALLRPSRVA